MQLQVARIGKPHGIRGEVTVQVLTDAPGDRFVPGTQFVVEPASAGPLTVESRPGQGTKIAVTVSAERASQDGEGHV